MTKEEIIESIHRWDREYTRLSDTAQTLADLGTTVPRRLTNEIERVHKCILNRKAALRALNEWEKADKERADKEKMPRHPLPHALPVTKIHTTYHSTFAPEPNRKEWYSRALDGTMIDRTCKEIMMNTSTQESLFHGTLTQIANLRFATKVAMEEIRVAALKTWVDLHRHNRSMPITFVKFCVWCAEEFARVKFHIRELHNEYTEQLQKHHNMLSTLSKRLNQVECCMDKFLPDEVDFKHLQDEIKHEDY